MLTNGVLIEVGKFRIIAYSGRLSVKERCVFQLLLQVLSCLLFCGEVSKPIMLEKII